MDTGTNAGTMVCLPPAPNWYKPLVTGGSDSGFYCYASKHNVVVLDARNGAPVLRECLVVAAPGTEIVTSVMFCRSERVDPDEVPALLTVTSDGIVQVWDVKTRAVKHTVSSQSSACCADWRGTLSTSVVFNGRDVAAVGYYNGTIVVQGLKNGSNVLYKLKGHSLMVLSLSWDIRIIPGEDPSPQPLRLCSTAFDRTLKIWDVAGERLLTSLKVPLSKKGKGVDVRDKWIAACWIPGGLDKIVASSIAGDVCVYDPSVAPEWSFLDCDADSGGHTASVYNVCIVGDAEKGTKMYAVSTSEDRNIVFWDLATKKSVYCIPCAGGFIYSLAFSPFAYATLAVGSVVVAVEATGTQSQSSVSTVPAKPPSKASSASGSKKKSKTVKSYFPCFSQFENLPKENRSDDAQYLADVLAKCNGGSTELDSAHSHLGMYTDAPGALTVLEKEIRHHKQEHNLDYAFQMMAWKGDLATALREAAAERRLTDSLVAQAPSLSRSVWFEMCERYAAQLSSEGEHHRAVLYYLACHKVELAVNLLCENSLYREALAIARAHLPEDDPQIERIYAFWAERASGVGNFEQAAKCYLAIGDAAKAVSSLMNRRDPHSLRSAAYIAKKSGLLAEMETTFQAALQASLTNNEWDQTVRFVEEQGRSRAFVTFIQLHKALIEAVDEVSREKVESVDAEDSTCRVLWSSRKNTAATFLSSVVRAYESNGYQPLTSTLGFTELSELLGFGDHAMRTVLLHDTKEHVLFHVAGCLAVSLFSPDLWTLYLARALSAAYTYNRELFVNLCTILFRGKVTDSTFTGKSFDNILLAHSPE
ncbi:hypothetical protein HPB50_015918 [Hyalomma asiaticum]|uniref:Uncharacterized protein n=1 Tax=Hyalomma asiaticum TaxID=266040 RepID=A0ACB7RUV9_HYAAI|nr:hypothetical protein HPB50_015918 [Hyalomma asiaticum]